MYTHVQANPYERIPLSDLETYMLLLQEHDAISYCNYSFTAFVIQDWNEETKKLKVMVYKISSD